MRSVRSLSRSALWAPVVVAVLKAEIGTNVWETREAARADVFRYIEIEYNRSRLRKYPEYGYVTPLETRTLLRQDLTPAA